MKNKSALLWDLDGTLMNTHPNTVLSMVRYLKAFGIDDFTEDSYNAMNGMTLEQQLELINKKYGHDINIRDFRPTIIEIQKQLMKEQGFKIDETLEKFILGAKFDGLSQVVVTSSIRHRAEDYLRIAQIYELFDFLVTKDDVERHKPSRCVFAGFKESTYRFSKLCGIRRFPKRNNCCKGSRNESGWCRDILS